MGEPFAQLSPESRSLLRPGRQPRWVDPMLATLTDRAFSDPGWIYERKLDGERIIAYRDGGSVRLMTRNRKDITTTYPEVAEALADQGVDDFVVDGEVVAFEGAQTSFARLQRRLKLTDPDAARRSGVAVYYYVFDLVFLLGNDLRQLALRDRKQLLRSCIDFTDPLRFSTHRNAEGEAYLAEACGKGWEGLIAKDSSSGYVGTRSKKWLKLKCVREQELVIGGFTDPQGSRRGFGALLVGYHEGGKLRYAGKVGTGYDDSTLVELRELMAGLEREDPPFAPEKGLPGKQVHWIRPELVGQFGFTEWTGDGKLRHPRFKGLRRDKQAREVIRERP